MRRKPLKQSEATEMDTIASGAAIGVPDDLLCEMAELLDVSTLHDVECARFFKSRHTDEAWRLHILKDITTTPQLAAKMSYHRYYIRAAKLLNKIQKVLANPNSSPDTIHTLFAQVVESGYEKYAPLFAGRINVDAEVTLGDTFDANRTFLHRAARRGNSTLVRWLLENHANVDLPGDCFFSTGELGVWGPGLGDTPLILACRHNHVSCVTALINFGADVNYQEGVYTKRETALHAAADKGHIGCVRLLLDANARVDLRNDDDKTAYEVALNYDHHDCAELIKQRMLNLHLPIPNPSSCTII